MVTYTEYQWSPRWGAGEAAARIFGHLEDTAPQWRAHLQQHPRAVHHPQPAEDPHVPPMRRHPEAQGGLLAPPPPLPPPLDPHPAQVGGAEALN